ncbi:alpha/beta hydrolase [Sphingomonas sp. S1-29]|uniref:alpha/beta hydrolase n=1 Tax=Sphingomonas sp. S1-29 TaxID=2991074 RepID=UPI00223F3C98|nr:alpha/beta hydrolase [Sphingomonas sp. S1-29]UZK70558.1 alpha/beta hydrolase [Sphingomonas sp. S1-29]
MTATALVPDMTRPSMIGIGAGLGGIAERLGSFSGLPRFDCQIALGAGSAAARSRFAYQLDAAVREADRSVLLIGAGVACSAIAWWARLSPRQYTSRVVGALFLAPEDGDRAAREAFLSPREKLGFPSVIVDRLASDAGHGHAAAFADSWGSRMLTYVADEAPALGASTPWNWLGHTIRDWTGSVVEHDVRRAASLAGRSPD